MAVYRFKVVFEDFDEVSREIDLLPKHTLADFHNIIQKSNGYDPQRSAAFYKSNDKWKKVKEWASRSVEEVSDADSTFATLKLSQCIDDPHQKIYYIYDFEKPYYFQIELMRILQKDENEEYPRIVSSIGEAPKAVVLPPPAEEGDDFELDEEDLDADEESDMDEEYGMGEDDFDFLEGEEGIE